MMVRPQWPGLSPIFGPGVNRRSNIITSHNLISRVSIRTCVMLLFKLAAQLFPADSRQGWAAWACLVLRRADHVRPRELLVLGTTGLHGRAWCIAELSALTVP